MDKAASAGHSDRCRIVVDTCCDFSPEVAANLDVDILGFPFIIDGEERTDDIWSSMSPKEFYDRMRAGARVSTSAVSLGRYIEFFTECAKEGTPTVYLCFTSALSSSYNSACQAADAVRAEYPDFELYVVDNALPCATGALLALEAVRQRSAGSWSIGQTRQRPTSTATLRSRASTHWLPAAAFRPRQRSSRQSSMSSLSSPTTWPARCR